MTVRTDADSPLHATLISIFARKQYYDMNKQTAVPAGRQRSGSRDATNPTSPEKKLELLPISTYRFHVIVTLARKLQFLILRQYEVRI